MWIGWKYEEEEYIELEKNIKFETIRQKSFAIDIRSDEEGDIFYQLENSFEIAFI